MGPQGPSEIVTVTLYTDFLPRLNGDISDMYPSGQPARHALAIQAQLATANVGEFKRARGLKILDWLA